jgi:hypothetical protein
MSERRIRTIYNAWIKISKGGDEESQKDIDCEKELGLQYVGLNGDRYSRISLITIPDSQIDLSEYAFLGEIVTI